LQLYLSGGTLHLHLSGGTLQLHLSGGTLHLHLNALRTSASAHLAPVPERTLHPCRERTWHPAPERTWHPHLSAPGTRTSTEHPAPST